MTEFEKMRAGQIYDTSDPTVFGKLNRAHDLCAQFNATRQTDEAARKAILKELLPNAKDPAFVGPIYFDFGCNTTIGSGVFANFNLTVLDCAEVTIGDNVFFGPNVSITPPVHPLRYQERNLRTKPDGTVFDYEYAKPVTIGSNCWIATGVTIIGGVTIGEGCVIGAGSVVTRDIPPHSLAAGVPCRVIRPITEDDSILPPELQLD